MSNGQAGSWEHLTLSTAVRGCFCYINFLFFKRNSIQLNSFKSFIFSFLKRSICILFVLFWGIPRGLSKFPAFSSKKIKTFNNKNNDWPKWGRVGLQLQERLFKVNVQMAFKASHSVMESCYFSVVKIHWHTLLKVLQDHAISSQNWNCPRISEDSDSKNQLLLHIELQLKNNPVTRGNDVGTINNAAGGVRGGEGLSSGTTVLGVNEVVVFSIPWAGSECGT